MVDSQKGKPEEVLSGITILNEVNLKPENRVRIVRSLYDWAGADGEKITYLQENIKLVAPIRLGNREK
jgi:hypothetical protein